MSRAAIISVGNELLSGQCIDTNKAWLGEKLFSLGVQVVSGYTVADEIDIVSDAIEQAGKQADIIIITGGLGPTDDDLTRQAVARYLGVELEYIPSLYDEIKSYFQKRQIEMPEKNRVQAYLPAGSEPIPNPVGTAPGVFAKKDGKIIAAIPGVPSEMKRLYQDFLEEKIKQAAQGESVVVRRLKLYGIGESALAEKLGDLMQRGRNPQVNCTVKQGLITLHIVARGQSSEAAEKAAEQCENELLDLIGEYVIAIGDKELENILGEVLIGNGKTLAVAESCTGGLIAKMLTDQPGASAFFKCGWVTYTNEAKNCELGVPQEILDEFGAVSEQTARAMSKGALEKSGADVAISVTGIAGPGGGTEQKPLGLVYISLARPDNIVVKECHFPQGRAVCRLRSAQTAMYMVIEEFLR